MEYDLVIIGAGPAGYVAALRAGQVGMRVALVEKEALGGLCLNWGCIPIKALMESARLYKSVKESAKWGIEGVDPSQVRFNWQQGVEKARQVTRQLGSGIQHLLNKHAVTVLDGEARIVAPDKVEVNGKALETKAILIATGAKVTKGIFHGAPPQLLCTPQELLATPTLPDRILVYGCGGNAAELAQLLAMIGHQVHLACPEARLLEEFDPIMEKALLESLHSEGVTVTLNMTWEGFENGCALLTRHRVPTDLVVIATRREAVVPSNDLHLRREEGFLATDEFLRCSVPGIYAAGDVTGRSSLAHVASAEGLHVVNHLQGSKAPLMLGHYPFNVYATPELAQIGLTETQLKQKGAAYKVHKYPLHANGKALAEGQSGGFLRLLSSPTTGEVLGVQIVARHASDMIGEAAAWIRMEGTIFDIASTLHAHPTVSEVFLEAIGDH